MKKRKKKFIEMISEIRGQKKTPILEKKKEKNIFIFCKKEIQSVSADHKDINFRHQQ